jgi:hypothetical protein
MEWLIILLLLLIPTAYNRRTKQENNNLQQLDSKKLSLLTEAPEEDQEKVTRLSPGDIRWIMDRVCLRKKNLSEEEANEVVDWAAKQGRVLYFYKCEFCGSHHMTSKEQGVFERRLSVC